jgi:hypothetical protein
MSRQWQDWLMTKATAIVGALINIDVTHSIV